MQKASELISLPDPLPDCIVPVKGKLRLNCQRHFRTISIKRKRWALLRHLPRQCQLKGPAEAAPELDQT